MSITATELAARTRASSYVRISDQQAAMFLGYWLQHGLVEEPSRGHYRLTPQGEHLAHGLLAADPEEAAA